MRSHPARTISFCALLLVLSAAAQQPPPDVPLDAAARNAVIDALASKLEAGYIVPETGTLAVQFLQKAKADGKYNPATTALDFAQKITADLRSVTNDKHLALNFDPAQ